MYVVPVAVRYEPVAERDAPMLWPPVCAACGVSFVLFQKHTESPFTVRTTQTTTGAARCMASGEWVPAMSWTVEMEQEFFQLRATATLAPASFRFQRRFLIVAAVVLAVAVPVLGAILWYGTRPNDYQLAQERIAAVAAQPSEGDAVLAQDPLASPGTMRWFIVRSVSGSDIVIQAAAATTPGDYSLPDLGQISFTGSSLRVPRDAFLADGFLEAHGPPAVVLNALPADARDS